MTRFWPEGLAIEVTTDASGQPTHLVWQDKSHHVQGITRQWRIDVGWWKHHIWRDYFKLYTGSDLLVMIFHDLQSDTWYLQRLYD